MSIYRKNSITFGIAAVMLTAAAGSALAQTPEPENYRAYMAYSAAPAAGWDATQGYNLLVGPGVTTIGIAPGDRTTPVGAD